MILEVRVWEGEGGGCVCGVVVVVGGWVYWEEM